MVVTKSMGLHLVPSSDDLTHQGGMRHHLLTQTEEGGPQGELIKPVEHQWGRARVGAVIECERHSVRVTRSPSAQLSGKGANGQPLPETDDTGHHVCAGGHADRDKGSSRGLPPAR